MLKLEIKMDERKIADERKYTAKSIYQALEKTFSKQNFRMETGEEGSLIFVEMDIPEITELLGRSSQR